MDLSKNNIFKLTDRFVSIGVFCALLLTYWLTVPPTVSYWDCPEYVTAACRLEVGHPPGNPVWMLAERFVTLFFPAKYAALAINLSSGIFTALAGMLLSKCIFIGAVWILKGRYGSRRRLHSLYAALAAGIGALAFGWCDSTWFSAVEAEVYAMSIFLSALSFWLMLKWVRADSPQKGWRFLLLLAYVFGLSIGVHQLNLLCIPALALVWGIRRGINSKIKLAIIFCISLAGVGCILDGMMPSTIALAAQCELIAVNYLHLPFLSGVVAYILLLGAALILALVVTARSSNKGALALSIFPLIFLSGIFILSQQFLFGAAISLMASLILVRGKHFLARRLNLAIWMLAMILVGYSAYALIPIRGGIPAPPNATLPGEPFSFASYQAREQYGSKPLLYGATPYSKPIVKEQFLAQDSTPVYSRYLLKQEHLLMEKFLPNGQLRKNADLFSAQDSVFNASAFNSKEDAYVIKGYVTRQVLTPELNMWFPRITSREPADLEAYESWIGMTPQNMTKVEISEAIDSVGNFVAKKDRSGNRTRPVSYRPTYLQNLQFLATYQIGYMYLRYLMWNFSGRQNDIPSQGEVEHGNFITGFPSIDNAMLEAEEALPDYAGAQNKGRNKYYLLPLILGIIGIIWLLRSGRRGQLACAVVTALFIMTGLAIVVYLNQTPGEPRERDYTFLGSYMAFAMWIAAGAIAVASLVAKIVCKILHTRYHSENKINVVSAIAGFMIPAAIVALMFEQNLDDHDRSGRRAASAISANILNSLKQDAIIFVDGDNLTFPLWYAQEVEGIRKDVKVINLSYLSSPKYVASVVREWDGAKAIPTTLNANDIIYNKFIYPSTLGARDSVANALDALEYLRSSKDAAFNVKKVRLNIPGLEPLVLPLSKLSNSGESSTLEFRRLMIFDIIANNCALDNPRPIYWIRPIANKLSLGLFPHMQESLFAYKLGNDSQEVADSLIICAAKKVIAPNDNDNVYMDKTPATQIAYQRAAITSACRLLLSHGKKEEALEIALNARRILGSSHYSFASVLNGDSIFKTASEYGKLFIDLGEQLNRNDLRYYGDSIINLDTKKTKDWMRYRQALSPQMRQNMSTIR